jgi:DNA invertase Pin-like site-specific DNA recombinase
MLIGYARVSTGEQVLDSQLDALKEAGCEQLYTDVASGAKTDRPGLEQALKALRKGDVLVVYKLDRIGRSLPHLIQVVSELERREVGFRVLKGAIDTTTPAGKLVFHMFGALAEFERELIRERVQSGLEAARARGRTGGRPPKMTPSKLRMAMTLMADPQTIAREVAAQLGVSPATLYRYVDGKGQLTAHGKELLGA